MTIDELFSMPIFEMGEWMSENYRDPQGIVKHSYWFTDIKECFGIEFPDNCGWKIIPCMSCYYDKGTAIDIIKRSHYETLKVAVAKVSKYGECMTYILEGSFETKNVRKRFPNGREYIDYEYKYELNRILCPDTERSHKCRVYLDGPSVVNNSELGVYYRLAHYDNYSERLAWLDDFEFIDKYESIGFKGTPVLSSPHKNKHTLNEFAEKLEKYAKKVQDIGSKAYNDNKDIVDDKEFVKKCKLVHLTSKEIFDVWLSLYVENQNVTFDDVIGMMRLSESKEELIVEYVDKCKCDHIEKHWDGKWSISGNNYDPYSVCLLYGRKTFTLTDGFAGYIKNLDKTRELYNSLDGYKNTVKLAKAEYKDGYIKIAKSFEDRIRSIYGKISKELDDVKDEYLVNSSKLYRDIHQKYKGINDSDVGIYESIPNIVSDIHRDFEKAAVKLMRVVDSSYKKSKPVSNKSNTKGDTEFLDHCKKLFDVAKNLDKIIYYSIYKAYDAPYKVYYDTGEDTFDEESIYDYEEKYGQGSFEEWLNIYDELLPGVPGDWQDIGADLYPGCSHNLFVNRKLEFDSETTN